MIGMSIPAAIRDRVPTLLVRGDRHRLLASDDSYTNPHSGHLPTPCPVKAYPHDLQYPSTFIRLIREFVIKWPLKLFITADALH